MEERVAKLEADLTAIKIDVAVIKANGATKSDLANLRAAFKADIADLKADTKADIANLQAATKADLAEFRAATKADIAELKTAIADAKASILMWVVTAIFVAQLLPLLKSFIS